MGEIGIPRKEYLYELRHVDIILIQRGYDRRHRHPWSVARWETFNLMSAFSGSKAMNEAGIHRPTDLLKFPWEEEKVDEMSQADIEGLQAEMAAWNKRMMTHPDPPDGRG